MKTTKSQKKLELLSDGVRVTMGRRQQTWTKEWKWITQDALRRKSEVNTRRRQALKTQGRLRLT